MSQVSLRVYFADSQIGYNSVATAQQPIPAFSPLSITALGGTSYLLPNTNVSTFITDEILDVDGGYTEASGQYQIQNDGQHRLVFKSKMLVQDIDLSASLLVRLYKNGSNVTSEQRLIPLTLDSMNIIEEAFDIEATTNDIYEIYITMIIASTTAPDVQVAYSSFDVKTLYENPNVDLDVNQADTDIKAQISSVQVDTFGEVMSLGTQQFTLPSTATNDMFFGYVGDVGSQMGVQQSLSMLTKPFNCQLLVDGAVLIDGYLSLDSITTDNNGDIRYIVSLTDSVPTLSQLLKDKTLADLDWSSYDSVFSPSTITASWGGDLFDGDIIYPNIFYGYSDEESGYNYGYGDNSIFNGNDLPYTNFKPAIRNKAVIDNIFNHIGLEYTSSFIEGQEGVFGEGVDKTFLDTYLLTTPSEKKGVIDNVNFGFQGGTNTPATYTLSTSIATYGYTETISGGDLVDTEVTDIGDGYDLVANEYTIQQTDAHVVKYSITLSNPNDSITNLRIKVGYDLNGIEVLEPNGNGQGIPLSSNYSNQTYTFVGEIICNNATNGDTLVPKIQLLNSINDDGQVDIDEVKVEIYTLNNHPDTTLMDLQFGDLKVMDYLKGLQQQFNLIFWADANNPRLINIEPHTEYINSGTIRDWSSKVDYSKKWQITHPSKQANKNIEFSNKKDDKDVGLKYTEDNKGRTLGSRTYESDSNVAKSGTTKIGDKFFAPTTIDGVENSNISGVPYPMVIPKIAGDDKKPIKFQPRLLFNNGVQTMPTAIEEFSNEYTISNADESITTNKYLQVSPFSTLEAGVDKYDLNFQGYGFNYGVDYIAGSHNYNRQTSNNAFNRFWANYVNHIHRDISRLVKLNIVFEPTDFLEFNINDTIFIDGHEYLINKISGYNFLKPQSTEVELLKKHSQFGNRYAIYTAGSDDERERGFFGEDERRIEYFFSESSDGTATPTDALDLTTELSGSIIRATQYSNEGYTKDSNNRFTPKREFGNVQNSTNDLISRGDRESGNVVRTTTKSTQVRGTNNQIDARVASTNLFGNQNVVGVESKDLFVAGDSNNVGSNINQGILITSGAMVDRQNSAISILGGEGHIVSGSDNDGITIVSTTTQIIEGENNDDIVVIGGKNDLKMDGQDSVSFINTNLSSSLYGYSNNPHHGGTQKHIYSTIINDSLAGGDVPSSALDGFPSSYNTSSFGVYPAGRSTTFINNRNMSNEYGLNGDNGEFINSAFINNNNLNIERFNNSVSAFLTHHQMFINTSNARFRFDDTLNTHYNNIFQGRTISNQGYMFDTYINPQNFVAPYMVDNWMSNSSIISASNTIGNHVMGSNVDMGGVDGSGTNTLRDNLFVNSSITRPNQQDTIISENIYEIADNTIIQTDITAFQSGRENILIGNQNLTSSYIDGDVLSGFEGGTTLNNVACLNNSDVDFYEGEAWGATLIGNQNLNVGRFGFNTAYINNMGAGSTMLNVSASINSTYINNTLEFNQELYDNSPTSQSVVLGKSFHAGSVFNGYQQIDFDGGASGLAINIEANVVLFNHGNTSSSATTITLPSAVDNDGMRIVLKDNGNASATFSYRVASTDGIDSSTFIVFNTAYQTETIMAMGGQWFKI